MSDLPTRDELNEWLTDVLTPAEARRRYDEACHWDAGKTDHATMMAARATRVLMTREEFIASLDMEAAAKAEYQQCENCGPQHIEQIWAWESMKHDEPCDPLGMCGRCTSEDTVIAFTESVQKVIAAALGEDPE